MKNRVLIFTIGLLAGLTIGVLFSVAIKELVAQFKELHISLNRINMKQSQLSQRLDSIQGKLIPDTKKTANSPTPANVRPPAQTVKSTSPSEVAKSSTPSITNTDNTAVEDDSDVVVMTNQLITTMNISLHNNDTSGVNRKTTETDSALASMSDVSDTRKGGNFRVEFWKSPLNYKGYKMSDRKIVLYGISPDTPPNLVWMDDTYYLLVNQTVYKIGFTDDYKPFDRITDKLTLKKLGI